MPSVSKNQRRLMAMCEHHPEDVKGECPKMSKEKMHDFAKTKEKGLPMRAKGPHKPSRFLDMVAKKAKERD